MAVWDHIRVYERTVYPMHRALTNNICFFNTSSALTCASASSDGLLKVVPYSITLDTLVFFLTMPKADHVPYAPQSCHQHLLL